MLGKRQTVKDIGKCPTLKWLTIPYNDNSERVLLLISFPAFESKLLAVHENKSNESFRWMKNFVKLSSSVFNFADLVLGAIWFL